MKMIFILIIYYLALFAPYNVYAGEYSLDDLYRMALERSDTIKIAEEDVSISESDKARALADLIPTISAFGHHTHYSKEQRASGFLLQPKYTNEWGLRLANTYSTGGGQFTALGITKQGIVQSRFDLTAVKEDYLMVVAAQYYDVLRAKREIEIAAATVQRLTTQRDAAKKRLEVGEAIKTALLRAESALAGAQSDLIRAENILTISKNILAKTARISGEYDVKDPRPGIDYIIPKDGKFELDFLIGDCSLPTLDCLSELALSQRPEIRSLIIENSIAEDGIKIAKSFYWPDFSIEGVYAREENSPSPAFSLDESIYAGLRLDFPFFEGGLKKARLSEAKSRRKQAEYGLADLKQEVNVEVRNSYIAATTAASVLRPREAEVEFAKENFNLVSKQFQYGLADTVAVMDANTALLEAELELTNAQFVYAVAILQLMRDTGMLLNTVVGSEPSAVSERREEEPSPFVELIKKQ